MKLIVYAFFLQWTVQLEPKFHEDANNLEELVPFEECIQLHSTDKSVVKPPEYLLLTHNGRSFKLVKVTLLLPISIGIYMFESVILLTPCQKKVLIWNETIATDGKEL